jgi:hypothetical protein
VILNDRFGRRRRLLELIRRLVRAPSREQARRETLRRGLKVAGENGADGWEKRFQDALNGVS